MNKRIRELAWENGCRARKFTKGVAIYPNVDEDLERFALAIIRECGELVKARLTHIPDNQDNWDGHNYGETAAVYGILDAFQEHLGVDCDQKNSKFGVEE